MIKYNRYFVKEVFYALIHSVSHTQNQPIASRDHISGLQSSQFITHHVMITHHSCKKKAYVRYFPYSYVDNINTCYLGWCSYYIFVKEGYSNHSSFMRKLALNCFLHITLVTCCKFYSAEVHAWVIVRHEVD